jgi:ribosome-associated protein
MKDLGTRLVALSPAELAGLPLSETLLDAIELAHRITAHGAAARHRARIGKLLRHSDVDEIEAAIRARELTRQVEARDFHRVEAWRDRLVAEGLPALEALAASTPGLDRKKVLDLLTAARATDQGSQATRAARELFRYLRDALAQSTDNP